MNDTSSDVQALPDHALLEALIGADPAPALTPPLPEVIARTPEQLRLHYGLSPVRTRRCAALAEVHHRLVRHRVQRPVVLESAEQVAELMTPLLAAVEVRRFYCLPLDDRLRLIGEPVLCSSGDVDATLAHPRVFFRPALRCGAIAAIAVHNHPSGCEMASYDDVRLTRALVRAGKLIGIPLRDHVVIAGGSAFTALRSSHPKAFG